MKTADGWTPIEAISVGDYVWSRDEQTGEEGYQPVVTLFETQPVELVHLAYAVGDETGALVGTYVHPIWSVTREEWVEMGELEIGERLLLADGTGEAVVVAKHFEQAAEGEHFTTYNFEVRGWHTYFVAPKQSPPDAAAVWVHNEGKNCDQIEGFFDRTIGTRHGQRAKEIYYDNYYRWGPKLQKEVDKILKSKGIDPKTMRGEASRRHDQKIAQAEVRLGVVPNNNIREEVASRFEGLTGNVWDDSITGWAVDIDKLAQLRASNQLWGQIGEHITEIGLRQQGYQRINRQIKVRVGDVESTLDFLALDKKGRLTIIETKTGFSALTDNQTEVMRAFLTGEKVKILNASRAKRMGVPQEVVIDQFFIKMPF